MDEKRELSRLRDMVERYLESCFNGSPAHGALYESMRYSLLAGGKRIRPVLTLAFCQAAGGEPDRALPLAAAIEMVHTYSLIHDDLPSMDNDSLRRGRPTNHRVFGESMAILAGDALQAAAFSRVLWSDLSAQQKADAALVLARAAGEDGMVAGQVLDLEGERRPLAPDEIAKMNALKTGCLLEAACVMGVIAAGGTECQLHAARGYASALGLAFQVRDDMLDETSTAQQMGKTVGKDRKAHKSTYVARLGLDGCKRLVAEQTALAKQALQGAGMETKLIFALADELAERIS
jgi:geranylgeranyl diphosphate synthase type II